MRMTLTAALGLCWANRAECCQHKSGSQDYGVWWCSQEATRTADKASGRGQTPVELQSADNDNHNRASGILSQDVFLQCTYILLLRFCFALLVLFFLIDWNHIFWCKIYFAFYVVVVVFLFLIPGRRQLPKLWKFPGVVLRCRLHPSPPSKKYVCKQTFDCCREYKCMCNCIAQKSYSELPYKLPTLAY